MPHHGVGTNAANGVKVPEMVFNKKNLFKLICQQRFNLQSQTILLIHLQGKGQTPKTM